MAQPRHRVIVVDDNADIAQSLCDLVSIMGHECWYALDGARAIELTREHDPELVLLDISLPDMTGYDVARTLRHDDEGCEHSRCIVALSGWGQPDDRARSREAGMDQHLIKPLELSKLQQIINELPVR